MPYSSIAELKSSETYKKSKTLQSLNEDQLQRFLGAFNSAYERAIRNSASQEEAESTAFAIAYGAARNTPRKKAALEKTIHYFTPFTKEMIAPNGEGIGGQENSFEFVRKNVELINIIMAGSEFNFEHDHNQPVGRIASLILPEQVPEEVKPMIDKDAPFVISASYYEDTPQEIKDIESLSPEWRDVQMRDGRFEIIPDTFAVTKIPLNPTFTGVKRVANLANIYKEVTTQEGLGLNMADSPETLSARMFEGLKAELTAEKTKIASLEGQRATAEAKLSAAETKVASLDAEIGALKTASAKKDADAWAKVGADVGKYPQDAIPKFASLYLANPTLANEIVTALPVTSLPAGGEKAVVSFAGREDKLKEMVIKTLKGE